MASSKKCKSKSTHLEELEAVFEQQTRRFSAFDILGLNDNEKQYDGSDTPVSESDRGVLETDTPVSQTDILNLNPQEQLAAYEFRSKLTDKHRSVLSTLNGLRSLEQPIYTVPVGYGTLSRRAALHENYLRLTVIPRLAMLGLIGIARRSMQGTTYHLYYDETFIRVVCGEHQVNAIEALPLPELDTPKGGALKLPSWADRERWGDLAPITFQQLLDRAGSETLAKEVLDIIVHNETHGPQDQRVRNRRAVLAHYLKNPNAEIWPNEGYETLAVRRAREKHNQEMELQRIEEEALEARQKTARLRFLNSLSDKQHGWLKQEAKRRVDAEPGSRMLENRFPLYKAEEDRLIEEWRERSGFGEEVPEAD
jgi:hypothetical protein